MGLLVLPIKLLDLDPLHVKYKGLPGYGVNFKCPHCTCRIPILYLNTMDGSPSVPADPALEGNNGGYRWARSGLGWDDLTLHPSVDVPDHGHWWLIDGMVFPVS